MQSNQSLIAQYNRAVGAHDSHASGANGLRKALRKRIRQRIRKGALDPKKHRIATPRPRQMSMPRSVLDAIMRGGHIR